MQTDLNLGPGQESRQCWRLLVPIEVGVGDKGSADQLNQTKSFYIPARRENLLSRNTTKSKSRHCLAL